MKNIEEIIYNKRQEFDRKFGYMFYPNAIYLDQGSYADLSSALASWYHMNNSDRYITKIYGMRVFLVACPEQHINVCRIEE